MNTTIKPKGVRIIAAVVDTRNLTLYKTNGETIIIPQGDLRLRPIVESATPQLIRQGWADVIIDNVGDNSYAKFEQGGSGAVKFFRIAKDKLKGLFTEVKASAPVMDLTPVPVMSIGVVPVPRTSASPQEDGEMDDMLNGGPAIASATPAQNHIATAGIYDVSEADEVAAAIEQADQANQVPKVEQTMSAIDEIMKHAIPVQSEEFHEVNVAVQGRIVESSGETIQKHTKDDESHTIIAVVDGNKIVPGMEKIKTQFGRAAKMGSTVGVEAFLRRLASVIEQRQHSVEDLLKFLERADLPIADDGTILIYKVLSRKAKDGQESGQKNFYVDCHSKKVEQFVGAYVCMDIALVDHNRRNECSNGLHVARRGYIRSFSGDVCVLAKLAPEDVIAVPEYDANKMRVCGYHIIAELNAEQYSAVKDNQPITSTEAGKQLLAKVMAGDHIHKTHEVRITQQMGGGVVVKRLERVKSREVLAKRLIAEVVVENPPTEVEALANPEAEALDQPIDPKDVIRAVEKAVLSRVDQAQAIYQAWLDAPKIDKDVRYAAVLAFKKAAKVSWERLGLPDLTQQAKPATKAKAKKGNTVTTPSVFPKNDFVTPSVFQKAEDEVKPEAKKVESSRIVNDVEVGLGSYRERVQKLMAIGLTSVGIATAVFKLKQQSKKSWTVLGVSEEQVAEIMRLKN